MLEVGTEFLYKANEVVGPKKKVMIIYLPFSSRCYCLVTLQYSVNNMSVHLI